MVVTAMYVGMGLHLLRRLCVSSLFASHLVTHAKPPTAHASPASLNTFSMILHVYLTAQKGHTLQGATVST